MITQHYSKHGRPVNYLIGDGSLADEVGDCDICVSKKLDNVAK